MAIFKIDEKDAKTTLVGADLYLIGDSEDLSGSDKKLKKVSHTNLLAYMQNNISFPGSDMSIKVTTSNYTILDDDDYGLILLDGTSNTVTATLPTLADNQGRVITIMTIDDTNLCDVDGEGAETINGMTSIELPKNENYIRIVGTSTEWKILSKSISCQLRVDTYAGHGSSDTKIMRFTNTRDNYGNMFSENHSTGYNSNTEGIEIIIAMSGLYVATASLVGGSEASNRFGFSLNSSQLTTDFENINVQDRLSCDMGESGTNNWGGTSFMGRLEKNDVLRLHDDGIAPGNTARCHLIITYLG